MKFNKLLVCIQFEKPLYWIPMAIFVVIQLLSGFRLCSEPLIITSVSHPHWSGIQPALFCAVLVRRGQE